MSERKFEIIKSGISEVQKILQIQDSGIIKLLVDVRFQQLSIKNSAAGYYVILDTLRPDTLFWQRISEFCKNHQDSILTLGNFEQAKQFERGQLVTAFINKYKYRHANFKLAYMEVLQPIGGWQNLYLSYYASKKRAEEKDRLLRYSNDLLQIPIIVYIYNNGIGRAVTYIYRAKFFINNQGEVDFADKSIFPLN